MVPDQVKAETANTRPPVVLLVSPASLERLGNGFNLSRIEVEDRPYLKRDGYWAYVLHRR